MHKNISRRGGGKCPLLPMTAGGPRDMSQIVHEKRSPSNFLKFLVLNQRLMSDDLQNVISSSYICEKFS